MARIVDLRGAISGRGYPPETRGVVTVDVTDPWPGGPNGTYRIEVANGEAVVEPTDVAADITIDVGALSALAIGRFTAEALGRAGRLEGSPASIARIGSMLAAPMPQIADDF
jgi:predicted acetyltransferase